MPRLEHASQGTEALANTWYVVGAPQRGRGLFSVRSCAVLRIFVKSNHGLYALCARASRWEIARRVGPSCHLLRHVSWPWV